MLDDARLLVRYRESGNLEFLGTLYHRYMHLVYGVAMKYLQDQEQSKDAVMQIFEILTDKVAQQDIRNFKAWLFAVTRNHCLGLIRKTRLTDKIEIDIMESEDSMHLNGEGNERQLELSRALSNLSEHQRRCIEMFYYENKSYREISDETGFDLKKVKSCIQNGKRNLKIYLDQYEQ